MDSWMLMILVFMPDGQQVPTPGSPVRREDAGSYFCAVLGQETVRSNSVTLNVQYGPENISISVDDQQFTEGSSVNLTCSSVANPAADNYSWYKRTDSPSSSSWLQVGWGQVLSLPSVEASHTGLYLCQASNSVGTGNSTAQLVTLITEDRGSQIHVIIIARVGVFVLVTLVVARLLYWATIGKSEASTIYSTVVTSS
ncbi:B-cell receptor CD22 isoform X4 [Pleuronectes platessa]|uniref:B-cell receptor CD22 isoform X4 n=1 Tax=Pleuronectes platessa TaxID=8262 RepID=UPI00232A6355|nr:B-cell receptor CD22 isoform X4 [Pleuronectes platessa]XP_053288554.1 B-cell receptor CD22 isoform X4 [Pleuronectes platessa]